MTPLCSHLWFICKVYKYNLGIMDPSSVYPALFQTCDGIKNSSHLPIALSTFAREVVSDEYSNSGHREFSTKGATFVTRWA